MYYSLLHFTTATNKYNSSNIFSSSCLFFMFNYSFTIYFIYNSSILFVIVAAVDLLT